MRDYQEQAINEIRSAFKVGTTKQLVVLPTGAGKTVVFSELARRMDTRTLILVHRDELISQTAEKMSIIWPEALVGVVKAERNELLPPVIVASVQTLSQAHRLQQINPEFGLVISDEAHHAVAPQWRRILDHVKAGEGNLHVGFTATPNRADGVGLGALFDKVVFRKTITEMIDEGYLVPPRGVTVKTQVDISGVRQNGGDWSDAALESVLNVANRNQLIVDAYLKHALGRKAIVFTSGVKHAKDLAETLNQSGVRAAAVAASTAIADRRKMLSDFRDGRLQALVNCGVLTEGYDESSVSAVILARPTQSQGLYQQMVGRGLRLHPGKRDCLVIDVADNVGRHRLVQLPDLLGRQAQASPSAGAQGPAAHTDDAPVEKRVPEGAGVAAREVNLLSIFNWIEIRGVWLLSLPGGMAAALLREGDGYRPAMLTRDGREALHPKPLPLEWAQGVAESKAREVLRGDLRLVRRQAGWRGLPPSEGQIQVLRRLGVEPSAVTRGEASDIISLAQWNTRLARLGS